MSQSSGSGGQGPMWGAGAPNEEPAQPAQPAAPADSSPQPPPAGPPIAAQPTTPSASLWGPNAAPPAEPAAAPPPATPPPVPTGPPPAGGMWGGAGGPPPPAQVQSGGIPGCLKIALILGALVIVALVVLAFLASILLNRFLGDAGGLDGINGGGDSIGADCPFLSDDEARQVLGGAADAIELSGFFESTMGFILDMRVLASAPDCWITNGERAYVARVARVDGNGAAVFAQEKANAQPTSQDQGGGVTLENPGYFGGDVNGLGDEAFCTGLSDAIMAGVVVRQGDTVVYASVGPPGEGQSVPNMGTFGDVITAPDLCALAQELARKALD